MRLTAEQQAQYDRNGFLVLENFTAASTCDRLRARAEEMVSEFDPGDVISIFSTRQQSQIRDDYFWAREIRFVSSLKRMPSCPTEI